MASWRNRKPVETGSTRYSRIKCRTFRTKTSLRGGGSPSSGSSSASAAIRNSSASGFSTLSRMLCSECLLVMPPLPLLLPCVVVLPVSAASPVFGESSHKVDVPPMPSSTGISANR